jgi:polyamine oxidase
VEVGPRAFTLSSGVFAAATLLPGCRGEGDTRGEHVVVVGAGMAGLAAARRLADEGVEVTVLAWVVRSMVVAEYAADPGQLSLTWFGREGELDGPDLILPGGYVQLAQYLVRGLTIRIGTEVTRIAYDGAGVQVDTSQGSVTADRVIATVPLGVLKAGTIAFDPPLPEVKQRAIERLGFGNGLTFARTPLLVGLRGGDAARTREELSDQDAVGEVLAALDAPEPTGALVTRWASDPYARGSYSFLAVGSSPADLP